MRLAAFQLGGKIFFALEASWAFRFSKPAGYKKDRVCNEYRSTPAPK